MRIEQAKESKIIFKWVSIVNAVLHIKEHNQIDVACLKAMDLTYVIVAFLYDFEMTDNP